MKPGPKQMHDKTRVEMIPEYNRRWYLKKLYGLTLEGYEQLVNDQDGVCAICFSPPTEEHLCVDHDHETGEIRSLLCRSCNMALGLFKESQEIVTRAARYLGGI